MPVKKAGERNEPSETMTAYHEAAHAVMAWYCSIEVLSVSIEPGEDHLGVTYKKVKPIKMGDSYRALEDNKEEEMMILLAGGLTKRIIESSVDWRTGSEDDRRLAYDLAGSIEGEFMDDIIVRFNLIEKRTEKVLRKPFMWKKVKRLVNELLKQKTIPGDRAIAIIESVK